MGILFFPMRLSDWRKECYVRFRRLYEENLADIYSSANSVGDVCPNSEDSDSISPDPASSVRAKLTSIPSQSPLLPGLRPLCFSHGRLWKRESRSPLLPILTSLHFLLPLLPLLNLDWTCYYQIEKVSALSLLFKKTGALSRHSP